MIKRQADLFIIEESVKRRNDGGQLVGQILVSNLIQEFDNFCKIGKSLTVRFFHLFDKQRPDFGMVSSADGEIPRNPDIPRILFYL